MLTKKQIYEIREHLEKAQNPLFLFDNDPDGLCSFLILQRYSQKGKGFPIRSFPELDKTYFKKAQELNSDYIFILDKPLVSKEFFEEANKFNIPLVWIDHHKIEGIEIPDYVDYYNPLLNEKKEFGEPTTDLCYTISEKEEDLWLAVIGSVSDHYVPKYYDKFTKQYPELSVKSTKAFDIFYKSEIGKIARMFSFALKDRITNVILMLKYLMQSKNPYDVLEENNKNHTIHLRFKQIDSKYQKLIEKALSQENDEKIIFFKYSGDMSISADLANELCYRFPKKIIVVIYVTGMKANISIRGKNIREKVLRVISELEDATGGGHEDAVGAKIKIDDLEKFKNLLKKNLN